MKNVKITKDQYEKAQQAIVKLRKAEGIVKSWEDAKKANPTTFAHSDVLEVERDDTGKFFFKTSPKAAAPNM